MKRQLMGGALALAVALATGTAAAGGATTAAPAGKAVRAAKPQTEVTLYVMPQCGYCEKTRQLLNERGVAWKERDIASSAEAKREFSAKGGVGTPLIVIGDEVILGYDASRIDVALSTHGFAAK
jgi:glutaredoxin